MDVSTLNQIANFGVGMVIAVGFVYVVILWVQKNALSKVNSKKDDYLLQIVENNTEAVKNLSEAIHTMQLTLVQLNTKNDEILDKLRRMEKS
jgi:allophanate hydrolase subunit 1